MSTQPLTQKATTENERRVAHLYELYSPHITRYAERRAASSDASDVVAETFLTAWRRADDIPSEPHALPWLYGVARRVLANQRRGSQRRSQLHDRLLQEYAGDDVSVCRLESADQFQRVAKAMDDLSESDAELIRLTAWEGMTPGEIAESMGIEPNAARQRLHRARRRLALAVAILVAIGGSLAVLIASGVLTATDVVETEFHDNGVIVDDPAPDGDGAKTVVTGGDEERLETELVPSAEPATPLVDTPPGDESPAVETPTTTTPGAADRDNAENAGAAATATAAEAKTTPATTAAPSTTATPTTSTPLVSRTEGPFDVTRDLLSMHFDFAHLDEGHATVANAEIAADLGFTPWVVAGTQAPGGTHFVHDYNTVMNATFGSTWQDAGSDWGPAVMNTASAWIDVVDSGGRVFVAEAGVSDFTAAVLDDLSARRPELDMTALIIVVQHAQRNEDETSPAVLTSVIERTTYLRIDDGNQPNDTADLAVTDAGFETAALAGPFAAAWAVAFDAMPASELDFSDTVAVLEIVGVGTGEIADPGDFAARFIG